MENVQYPIEEQRLGAFFLMYLDLENEGGFISRIGHGKIYTLLDIMEEKYNSNYIRINSYLEGLEIEAKRGFVEEAKKIGINQREVLDQTIEKAVKEKFLFHFGEVKNKCYNTIGGEISSLVEEMSDYDKNIMIYQKFPQKLIHMDGIKNEV